MTAPRNLPVVIALAALITGCGTTGEHKSLIPVPWHPKVKTARSDVVLPPAGSGRGGYYQGDGPGRDIPDGLELVPDAVVRAEPYAKGSNRPYKVLGKTYVPIVHEEPYTQRGVATWYGVKFHGQRTSSGEPYDMYKMTAAHPTLPIPSYARITSVESGKSVIVRINDRGPFHSSRIVDVSYTAALKLGLLGKGSHQVELERLFPGDETRLASLRREATSQAQTVDAAADLAPLQVEQRVRADSAAAVVIADPTAQAQASVTPGFYLQLGAYSRADAAREQQRRLAEAGVKQLEVVPAGSVYRVYGGPFERRAEAEQAARALPASLGKPIVIRR